MIQPVIAITLGEPSGIGPEIALRAAWELRKEISIVLIGDSPLLQNLASEINTDIILDTLTPESIPNIRQLNRKDSLLVINSPLAKAVTPGYLDSENAQSVLNWLDIAIDGTVKNHFDAIVTAPVQKSIINSAGIPFTGHTEYLAHSLQTDQVVMLLAGKIRFHDQSSFLRVALATTHLPLKDISKALNQESLIRIIHILHQELRQKFGIQQPHILVSGLNPHAGENGYLGTEEIDTITPAIQIAQQQGIHVTGPFPADTLFLPNHLNHADCFLVMYHDQGLPVLKYATFGHGVNITLGLPIIRTSVDHGTALDVAQSGVGKADYGSMLEAIRIAADMASRKKIRFNK